MNKKIYFCFFVLIFFTGCATTQTANKIDQQKEQIVIDSSPFLRMKWAQNVSFNAYMDPANILAGNGAGHYDGSAGAAGVLAQILIHSAISSTSQKKGYESAQQSANEALSPYQNKLSSFLHSDLWEGVKSKDIGFKTYQEGDVSGVTVFHATPEFILSPDQRSIMVINQVDVYKSDTLDTPIYTNNFIVVSKTIDSEDIHEYWNDESERKFVEIGSSIFSDSIELAKKDFYKELVNSDKQKTFRYKFGKKKMYEHGQLINSSCSNTIMKNLRGYIYKIPIKNSDNIDCVILDDSVNS